MDKGKSDQTGKRIVDLASYRKNKTDERRREYERILFNRILGVYSFLEQTGLNHVEILDISYSGIKFREDRPEVPLTIGQKIALRFYFTPSSYLRLVVEIKRVTPFDEAERKGLEYGCELDRTTKSYEVLHKLVGFMETYSEVACQDSHPPMLFF